MTSANANNPIFRPGMGNVSAIFDISVANICTMSRAIACASARISPFAFRHTDGLMWVGRAGADRCDVAGTGCCAEVDACGCPREGEWERDIAVAEEWEVGDGSQVRTGGAL